MIFKKHRFSHLFDYRQVSLPLKIALPFTTMFLIIWAVGTILLGDYFSSKLDQIQQEQADALISLIDREFKQKTENLRRDARLLSLESSLTQAVSQKDQVTLQQSLIPLKALLEVDIIRAVDHQQQTLLQTQRNSLAGQQLSDRTLLSLIVSGTNLATVISIRKTRQPVLVGAAPIRNKQGIVGGIFLGQVIDNDLLSEINQSVRENLVVLSDGKLVASTFQVDADTQKWIHSAWESETIHALQNNRINREFLIKSIHIDGLDGEDIDLVLLISQKSLQQAQQSLWLLVAILASLISLLVTIVGFWLGRKIAQPIQSITATAQQVIRENNFELQTSITRKDEIGTLAYALNQLISWVGQYTHELETARATLEDTVQTRTQDLSQALQNLQDTQAQLIHTEKMSSLGNMVAGIAHEINNPINFIQGNLQPLQTYFQDLLDLLAIYKQEYPEASKPILDKQDEIDVEFLITDLPKIISSIQTGTVRVKDIVVSLRNYSRLDEAVIKEVDIHEGIDSTLLILNHRLKQGVEVIKDYGVLPLVRCSPSQLNQVFTNIIANALDAMLDANSQPMQLVLTTRPLPDQQVKIVIKDTGPGMNSAIKAKIFDPFFTTKAIGKGTGLGLGICFKIIQQHQGNIQVHSTPGIGTEFVITLPQKLKPNVFL
ncbi:ATP-binding protein [Leptolyngbya sp. PCC 6406]|uniref:sensor histidine kinase n=1 Tax=Leptolyngbya sp. PCC 6406 TaxID=1173264 RepID=UPI0002ACB733|nr:ATP-binding protein [Leptolyngbya sp. PCC 6406]